MNAVLASAISSAPLGRTMTCSRRSTVRLPLEYPRFAHPRPSSHILFPSSEALLNSLENRSTLEDGRVLLVKYISRGAAKEPWKGRVATESIGHRMISTTHLSLGMRKRRYRVPNEF